MKIELTGQRLILFIVVLILITLILDISISLIFGTVFTLMLKQNFLPIFFKINGSMYLFSYS